MFKFINNVALIEVNKTLEAVQITFRDSGDITQYIETLRMANSFANLHHCHAYLMIKNSFKDIGAEQFYRLLTHWLQAMEQNFDQHFSGSAQVALLTPQDTFLTFTNIMRSTQTKPYYHVSFDLFHTSKAAHLFLQPNPIKVNFHSL